MKDNRINGERDPEKELREKMSELSSNIDCFEKISARAFPEKYQDFSDSELVVSDLENVTGKRRAVPVLKWLSKPIDKGVTGIAGSCESGKAIR